MAYQMLTESVASALNYQFVNSSATISTASGAFVVTGLQITILESGIYWIQGHARLRYETGGQLNKRAQTALFLNGTELPITRGEVGDQLTGVSLAQNAPQGVSASITVVSLKANDIIQLRYRISAGNATVNADDRSLMIVKVG